MDSEALGSKPHFHVSNHYNDMILDPNRILHNEIYLQRTNYKNNDRVWGPKTPKSPRMEGFFYNIEKIIHRPRVSMVDPNVFYTSKLLLDS